MSKADSKSDAAKVDDFSVASILAAMSANDLKKNAVVGLGLELGERECGMAAGSISDTVV